MALLLHGTAPPWHCSSMALLLYGTVLSCLAPQYLAVVEDQVSPCLHLLGSCGAVGLQEEQAVTGCTGCTALQYTEQHYSALHCTVLYCPAMHCTALVELGVRTGGQGQNTIQGAVHTLMLCSVYSKVFRANKVVCNRVEYSALQCPVQFSRIKCHIIEQLGTFHFSREREQESREQTVIGRSKSANSYFTRTTLHCTALHCFQTASCYKRFITRLS